MEQRTDRLDVCIGHAPALRWSAEQYVGKRHNAHALMVRHIGRHRRERVVT